MDQALGPLRELDLRPTGASTVLAMTHQELFWYITREAPDAGGLLAAVRILRGPLDRLALARSLDTAIADHTILRTSYHEIAGRLHQTIEPHDRPGRCELEYVDRSPLPEAQWDTELELIRSELAAGLDAATGDVLRARLIRLAPDQHALVFCVHHIAADATALTQLVGYVFAIYQAEAAGKVRTEHPALQLIDVADALVRWSATPHGQASSAYWRERLSDAPAVEVPGDLPRASVDRRRDAAPLGLTPELMIPVGCELSARALAAVHAQADRAQVPVRTVHLAALFRLLQLETGQTDICIDAVINQRPYHPALAEVSGQLLTSMLYRVNVAGCASLQDVLARAVPAMAEADAQLYIDDYYRVVPHPVRRIVFIHVPTAGPGASTVGDLHVEGRRSPSARWKRPWDLQVLVIETPTAPFSLWAGADSIFSRDRLAALHQRYLDMLEQSWR